MKGRWIQSQEGLFLPETDADRVRKRDVGSTDPRRHLREVRGEYFQGWAALLLCLLGIPGIVIAFSDLKEQQGINRIEREAKAQQQERYQRRHASQIGWLDQLGDTPVAVHAENRSGVAIEDVVLVNEARTYALVFGTIVGCSSVAAHLGPLLATSLDFRALFDEASWVYGTLYFRDPVAAWARSANSLRAATTPGVELREFARVLTAMRSVALVRLNADGEALRHSILVPTRFHAPLDNCVRE